MSSTKYLKKGLIKSVSLSIALFLAGCGGSLPEDSDRNTPPKNPDSEQPQNPDPTPDPLDPNKPLPGRPTPTPVPPSDSTPAPGIGYRDIVVTDETEHYGTETIAPVIGIEFGLLESSGGSYELEPLL